MTKEWVPMTRRMHRLINLSREELIELARRQQKEVAHLRRKLQLVNSLLDKQERRRQHLEDLEDRCLPENAILIGMIDARPRRCQPISLLNKQQQVSWDEV